MPSQTVSVVLALLLSSTFHPSSLSIHSPTFIRAWSSCPSACFYLRLKTLGFVVTPHHMSCDILCPRHWLWPPDRTSVRWPSRLRWLHCHWQLPQTASIQRRLRQQRSALPSQHPSLLVKFAKFAKPLWANTQLTLSTLELEPDRQNTLENMLKTTKTD